MQSMMNDKQGGALELAFMWWRHDICLLLPSKTLPLQPSNLETLRPELSNINQIELKVKIKNRFTFKINNEKM